MVTVPPLARSIDALGTQLEVLNDARTEQDEFAESQALQTVADMVRTALIGEVDDDVAELSIFALSLLPADLARECVELALSDIGSPDSEAALRVREVADLSGHRITLTLPQGALTMAPRLRTGQQYAAPATSAKTGLANVTVIIHGTFAKPSPNQTEWWEPNGAFAQAVAGVVGDYYAHSDYFYWSGADRDADRKQAATDLIRWAKQRLTQGGSLRLVCHSHGGNVALLAARDGQQIDKLILLGTPVRTDYLPLMSGIGEISVIFSPTDHVQTGGTIGRRRGEGRTLADSRQIINYVTADPKTGHSKLHDWAVWTDPLNRFDKVL